MKTVILQIPDKDYDTIKRIANTPWYLVTDIQKWDWDAFLTRLTVALYKKIAEGEGR